ncbi:MAG: hypothetical protein WDM76_08930 [Limisphaerales bacterium]
MDSRSATAYRCDQADPYEGARPKPNEKRATLIVRVRTIADMISTGMIESKLIRLTTSSPKSPPRAVTETRHSCRRQSQRSARWKIARKLGIFDLAIIGNSDYIFGK